MKKENIAAIAAHDQHRAAHFAEMRKAFLKAPKRFRRRVEKTMQFVNDWGGFADHNRMGCEMLAARLAYFGFHALFEHMSLWEEELDAAAEDEQKGRQKPGTDRREEETGE